MISAKRGVLGIEKRIWLYVCVLTACLCLGIRWSVFYFAALVFGLLVLIFRNEADTYCILLFLLPSEMIIKTSPASASLFTYFVLLATVVLTIKKNSIKIKFLALFVVFFGYLLIGAGKNYTDLMKMGAGMLLFSCFVASAREEDFPGYVCAFALGMLVSCFIGSYKTTMPELGRFFSDWNREYIGGEPIFRFSGLYLDPNYFSISVIIAVYLCGLLFMKKKDARIAMAALIVALIVFGMRSYSRLFFLCLGIVAVLFVLGLVKGKKTLKWGVVAAIALIIAAIYLVQFSDLLDGILGRFDTDDISNNRFAIWSKYLGYILSNTWVLLFGRGIGASYYTGVGPHNTYVESWYFLGFVGSLIYVATVVCVFRSKRIQKKRVLLNYGLLAVFLLMIATLGLLKNNDMVFYYMLLWVGLNFPLAERTEGVT